MSDYACCKNCKFWEEQKQLGPRAWWRCQKLEAELSIECLRCDADVPWVTTPSSFYCKFWEPKEEA